MALTAQIERVVRSRAARLALAAALVAAAAWAFLPYYSSRIASAAFVNAPLSRVTTPIAGRLTNDLPSPGDYVSQAETVKLVKALVPDQHRLQDLHRQHAIAKERAELARTQLEEVKAADREMAQRAGAYRSGMIERIAQEVDEAGAEKTGCLAEAQQRREVGTRMEQLAKQGTSSQIRSAEALASQEAVVTRCEMAAARHRKLTLELESVKQGIFLRDGANDVPYSQQQRDRLMLRRQEIEAELLNETSKITQFETAIAQEEKHLTSKGEFDLVLPANHVVWSTAASPGSTVVEGQFVMDLADCRNRFLVVELPERDFERINPGGRASVRLIGSSTWVDAYIRQLRGSAARMDDRLLAAQLPKPHSSAITVEVALPTGTYATENSSFCNIGRLAEVRFPRLETGLSGMISGVWRRVTSPIRDLSAETVAAGR